MTAAPDSPAGRVRLAVVNGRLEILGEPGDAPADLSWRDGVRVTRNGEPTSDGNCQVALGDRIEITTQDLAPYVDYKVNIASSRMEATLRVVPVHGKVRHLADCEPNAIQQLRVREEMLDPGEPTLAGALAAIRSAGVVFGLDEEAVAQALTEPGRDHTIAEGREPVPGRNGTIAPMVDMDEVRYKGILAGTPLLRRTKKREGTPGLDVTGKELPVKAVRDARFKTGVGVSCDEGGLLAYAAVDGQPYWDGDCFVEVREELTLEAVDNVTGDIDFCGSVRVRGHVGEGRTVRARHSLYVEGNVDRATLESGASMEVTGAIMSSVLRAGGERALAATVLDHIADVPVWLAEVATRAAELRQASESRGTSLPHGLSVQLVIEKLYRPLLTALPEAAEVLQAAGGEHLADAEFFMRCHRDLSTAAVNSLESLKLLDMINEIGAWVDRARRAVESSSDLSISYMQSSEADATGEITISGKGIFNCRIVAWGGLRAIDRRAVIRGGSIVSHGPIDVSELGSPGGTTTTVQLGKGSSLAAGLVYGGTLLTGPGHTHRFVADRSNVNVSFGPGGMVVESLAA